MIEMLGVPKKTTLAPWGRGQGEGLAISGRSMIEMLGVLAIIGVLSAGGIFAYSTAMENYKVNQTIEDINTITTGALNLFSGKQAPSAQWVGTDKLLALGVVPTRYKNSLVGSCDTGWYDCHTQSLFGKTAYFIYVENILGNRKNKVSIMLTKPTKSICVKLLQYDWFKSNQSQNWVTVSLRPNGGAVQVLTSHPTKSRAQEVCEKTSYIEFNFTVRK